MPRTTQRTRRYLFRVFFLSSVAGFVLAAFGRDSGFDPDAADTEDSTPTHAPARETIRPVTGRVELEAWETGRRSPGPRRAALATLFTALFFAGAALTAGAGDQAAKLLEDTTTDATSTSPADVAQAAAPAEVAPDVSPEPAAPAEPAEPVEPAEPAPSASEDEPEPAHSAPSSGVSDEGSAPQAQQGSKSGAAVREPAEVGHKASAPSRARQRPTARRASAREEADAEVAAHGGAAVVWLNRALPDPTPPARRLTRQFARQLAATSRAADTDWALVLGVLRAQGAHGQAPATQARMRRLARALEAHHAGRDSWSAVLGVTGRTATADQAVALARYNRAVGMESLVNGLAHEKARLVEKLLNDRRVSIYGGGRDDLTAGRIDVRVVALAEYLAESFGQVSISSLFSGHRLYARPGVVSAHIYGHAVDVTGLGGMSVAGNQEPGGLTEQAIRQILLLPAELQPRQVISLLGLGGASFPLADHYSHIHVGY